MNIQQLKHFVAVAERGSLLKAATDLSISQSGLSRSMTALESSLGLALFERKARGVALTPQGKKFLPRATAIIHEHARAKDEFDAEKELREGRLSVGLNNVLAYFLSNEALIEMLGRPSRIRIETSFDSYLSLRERTLAGEFDLAVSIYEPARKHPELVYEDLMPFESFPFANQHHRLTKQARVGAVELAACRWALIEGRAIQSVFEDYFRSHQVAEPMISLQCASVPFLVSAVAQLDLVTLLPKQITRASLEGVGELRPLPVEGPFGRGRIGLIYRRNGVHTPLANEFARLLRRHASRL
jgi:DNA-binding transcriptional LysR family regulator